MSTHDVQAAVTMQPSRPQRRRWYRSPLLYGFAAALLVLLLAGGIYLHFRPQDPQPPIPDLAGLDPAIVVAVQTAGAAVRKTPRSAEAWGRLGMVLVVHEFRAEAMTCFHQAEKLAPADPRWPYCQALALLFAGDHEAALPILERAVTLYGDDFDTPRMRLAEELVSLDRLDEAEPHFRHLLQLNPQHPRAQLGLARLAYLRGDPRASLEPLQVALDDRRTQKAACVLLANVQQRLGKATEAEEALRRAAGLPEDFFMLDPVNEEITNLRTGKEASIRRALNAAGKEREAEALALLQQTVKNYPEAADAWLQLGKMLLRLKNTQAAESALRHATELAPDAPDNVYNWGVALLDLGQMPGATVCFRKATELKPDFAAAWFNLGYCQYYAGDRSAALEDFRTALRFEPNLFDAHFHLARLLNEQGPATEALVHARYALQLRPADPGAQKLWDGVLDLLAVPLALP